MTSARELFQQPVSSGVQIRPEHDFLILLQDQAFRWCIQWWCPGAVVINQTVMPNKTSIILLIDQGNRTILQLKQDTDGWWRGKHHGEFPLWKTIEEGIEQFFALGKPERSLYRVQVGEREAWLQVFDAQSHTHALRDLYQP